MPGSFVVRDGDSLRYLLGSVRKGWRVGVGERRGMAIVINENLVTVPKLLRRHCLVAPHAPFIASQVALVKPVSKAQKH